MTQARDADLVIATWLDDGPIHLPDETRRAITVGLRTQPRTRPWAVLGGSWRTPLSIFVTAAAIVLAVGGLSAFLLSQRPGGVGTTPGLSPVVSPSPSLSPSPSVSPAAVPSPSSPPSRESDPSSAVSELTATFISRKHGYSVGYAPGWPTMPSTLVGPWDPVVTPQPAFEPYDYIQTEGGGTFRAASAVIPDGAPVDDWIVQHLTHSDVPACSAPRDSLETVAVDGQAGRLRGFCDSAAEIEVTVVVGRRVYLFTLFRGERATVEAEERALFDAMLATIQLSPEDAEVAPSASPA
jgi:hypothetical protein